MRVSFDVELPEPLATELRIACTECQCTTRRFAEEAVLSVLAGRRLATSVPAGRCGARVKENV